MRTIASWFDSTQADAHRKTEETLVENGELVRYQFQDGWSDGKAVVETQNSYRILFNNGYEELFPMDALLVMAMDYHVHYQIHLGASRGWFSRGARPVNVSPTQVSQGGGNLFGKVSFPNHFRRKYLRGSEENTCAAAHSNSRRVSGASTDFDTGSEGNFVKNPQERDVPCSRDPTTALSSYARLQPRLKVLCVLLDTQESKEDVQKCEDMIKRLIQDKAGV